eukprot:10475184-Alexandrium_andersonii.AAC.1
MKLCRHERPTAGEGHKHRPQGGEKSTAMSPEGWPPDRRPQAGGAAAGGGTPRGPHHECPASRHRRAAEQNKGKPS